MGVMRDYRIVPVYSREGMHKNYQLSFTGIPYNSSIFNLLQLDRYQGILWDRAVAIAVVRLECRPCSLAG